MAMKAARRSTPNTAIGSRGAAGWAPGWRYSVLSFLITPHANALPVPNHQNITILDDIFFAFEAQQDLLADARITSMVDQRLPVHHLGSDELLLEVAMDGPGRLHRGAVHWNGPGADFGFAGSQKRHQPQQGIGCRDQPFQARFLEPIAGQVFAGFF